MVVGKVGRELTHAVMCNKNLSAHEKVANKMNSQVIARLEIFRLR